MFASWNVAAESASETREWKPLQELFVGHIIIAESSTDVTAVHACNCQRETELKCLCSNFFAEATSKTFSEKNA